MHHEIEGRARAGAYSKRKTEKLYLHQNFLLSLVSVLALVAIFAVIPRLPDQPMPWLTLQFVSGGMLCPFLFLLLVRHGYLFARRYTWLVRQSGERSEVDALQIPRASRKPENFDGVGEIDAAQHRLLQLIPDAQGQYRARALSIYVAPALAILLASLQQTGWPTGAFAAGLLFGQVVLAFLVFLRIIIDKKPTEDWIERRTRSELMRREQYLCLARVGPYLDADHAQTASRVTRIESASVEGLTELVPMEHIETGDRPIWLECLSSSPRSLPVLSDLPERVASYQY